jgi:hypothetical protein
MYASMVSSSGFGLYRYSNASSESSPVFVTVFRVSRRGFNTEARTRARTLHAEREREREER